MRPARQHTATTSHSWRCVGCTLTMSESLPQYVNTFIVGAPCLLAILLFVLGVCGRAHERRPRVHVSPHPRLHEAESRLPEADLHLLLPPPPCSISDDLIACGDGSGSGVPFQTLRKRHHASVLPAATFHVIRPAFYSVLEVGARTLRPGGVNSGFTAPVRWSGSPPIATTTIRRARITWSHLVPMTIHTSCALAHETDPAPALRAQVAAAWAGAVH